MVSLLLQAGSDARATNNAGATALHYGVGNEGVVSLLLKAGADPNAESNDGTPLVLAAENGRRRVAELLIQSGTCDCRASSTASRSPA